MSDSPTTIYLDNAATTPLVPEVREAMGRVFHTDFGNPSSRHPLGVTAARTIDAARTRVARFTGADEEGVVFTSGGTEANNLAVLGLARARRSAGNHLIIGPTEHPSVTDSAAALTEEGFELETAPLGADGGIDVEGLVSMLRPTTVLVAQMLVNNEFGTVYDVPRIARLVRANAPRAALHVDAVQGPGKLDLSLGELGAHSLSISGHKVHGPKGSGALILAEGVRPRPLVFGGGQERGIRSGTENVAGIAGFARALELADESLAQARAGMFALRHILAEGLEAISGARLLSPGPPDCLSPAIAAVLLPGPPAEVWMHHLETRGVLTSVGSACHAKSSEIPPALLALGLSETEARGVLRVSFSRETTEDEVREACRRLADVARELVGEAR